MKTGNIIKTLLLVMVFVFTLGTAVYALPAQWDDESEAALAPFKSLSFGKDFDTNLTDEQKSEIEKKIAEIKAILHSAISDEQKTKMEAKKAEKKAKWDALSDAQKEELYGLQDKSIDAQIEAIDKCLTFGLIDQEMAQDMKERLNEAKALMREDGGKCMFNFGGFKVKQHASTMQVEIED